MFEGWFVPTGEISKASHGGVSLLKNHRVKRVDTKSKKVHLDDGRTIRYDKLLIATGRQITVFVKFIYHS